MNYRNAKKNKDGSYLCEVEHPEYGWIPYKAVPNDVVEFGVKVFNALEQDTSIETETDAEYEEYLGKVIRLQRDDLLKANVDPIVTNPLRYNSLTEEEKTALTDYRQKLLDITEQENFPYEVTFPDKP